jgi:hypothetical protein
MWTDFAIRISANWVEANARCWIDRDIDPVSKINLNASCFGVIFLTNFSVIWRMFFGIVIVTDIFGMTTSNRRRYNSGRSAKSDSRVTNIRSWAAKCNEKEKLLEINVNSIGAVIWLSEIERESAICHLKSLIEKEKQKEVKFSKYLSQKVCSEKCRFFCDIFQIPPHWYVVFQYIQIESGDSMQYFQRNLNVMNQITPAVTFALLLDILFQVLFVLSVCWIWLW